jgi:fumarylpyruvate hydrolase
VVGESPLTPAMVLCLGCVAGTFPLLASVAVAQGLVADGACRDGEPNGAYELRAPDGRPRVVGAFAKGKRTGTFLFWAENGARIAVIPYDNEHKSGTIAIWYPSPTPSADARRKSESTYVDDRLHGVKRSWHPNGNPRTDLLYERGEIVEARAWAEDGGSLPEAEAHAIAERDLSTDEQFYATLESFVADHRPKCDGRAAAASENEGDAMTKIRRRQVLQTAAVLMAGGVAASARPIAAQPGTRTPFSVPQTFIPIAGTDELFPVRRIYCIGRNYAAHAREMGSDPTREPPFFFQKPTDAVQLAPPGETVDHPYPTLTKNYHYEVELVAALAKGGRDVPPEHALDLVFGYTVGLDMTRRDLQRAMGDEKKPWEIGKSFDRSAVLGPLQPAMNTGHFNAGSIWLKVNGVAKQNANLNQMIWTVAEQVSNLSKAFELMPGDIIYSGTPENVGPVVKGDIMDAHIDGLPDLRVKIV